MYWAPHNLGLITGGVILFLSKASRSVLGPIQPLYAVGSFRGA